MSYQLETSFQQYGDSKYLDHNLKGTDAISDRRMFAQRVPSYGLINFGSFIAAQAKQIIPANKAISSSIMLRSLYSYPEPNKENEITLSLLGSRGAILAGWILKESQMYQTFPNGLIIDPSLTLEIKSKNSASKIELYWQPVHVIDRAEV